MAKPKPKPKPQTKPRPGYEAFFALPLPYHEKIKLALEASV
jgi:hypothetical protein